MVDLTIAVLNFNSVGLLDPCLDSIEDQAFLPVGTELLLVDNGSAFKPAARDGWRAVNFPDNAGNIEGMNRCFREAQGQWVLFVANDVRLHRDCVLEMWKYRQPAGVSQPVLYQPNWEVDNVGINWCWPGYGIRIRQVPEVLSRVPAFAATCFLMRRDRFFEVGGFDRFLRISHEDVDLSLRLKGQCWCVPTAQATHLMGQTIGKVVGRPLSPYYRWARKKVIQKHYRGLDRIARTVAVTVVDGLAALVRGG